MNIWGTKEEELTYINQSCVVIINLISFLIKFPQVKGEQPQRFTVLLILCMLEINRLNVVQH